MDQQEIRAHAERIIEMHNEEYEFCLVYEDDELEDASEVEWHQILDAMYAAHLAVTWDD